MHVCVKWVVGVCMTAGLGYVVGSVVAVLGVGRKVGINVSEFAVQLQYGRSKS